MATSVEEFVCVGDSITFESGAGGSLSVDECGNIFWEIPDQGECIYHENIVIINIYIYYFA